MFSCGLCVVKQELLIVLGLGFFTLCERKQQPTDYLLLLWGNGNVA